MGITIIIEMAVRKGLAEYPETTRIIPLGRKGKREIPQNSTPALIKQPSIRYQSSKTFTCSP